MVLDLPVEVLEAGVIEAVPGFRKVGIEAEDTQVERTAGEAGDTEAAC